MGIKKAKQEQIIDLNTKVDMFLQWYYENKVKGKYSKQGEIRKLIEMRDFIEKIAVWYELRFPDYEIDRIMNNIENNGLTLSFLLESQYYADVEWCKVFNTNVFIKLLPWEEKNFLEEPSYFSPICIESINHDKAYIHFTRDGYVSSTENIELLSKGTIKEKNIIGYDVYSLKEIFDEFDIQLIENNELDQTIESEDIWDFQREGILDSAMYRIIERGGNRIGPRRAFLFAYELYRDIDIPMKYGVDYSDPGLRTFINEYLKEGGSKELECYENYFNRMDNNEEATTITIKELLLKQRNNAVSFYTKEEDESHQKLVNTLAKIRKKKLHKKRHY